MMSYPGQLINKLQEHPNCVLLLDEIEKAHRHFKYYYRLWIMARLRAVTEKKQMLETVFLIPTTNLGAEQTEKNAIGFNRHGL